jgi:hypothetical protein
MVEGNTDQRRLSTSILPYSQHRTQGDTSAERKVQSALYLCSLHSALCSDIDDSPTKRYGRKVEDAGYHHNPTPGRTNAKTCFGHSRGVAVLVVTHPAFGEISFPVAAELYLRHKEIDKLPSKYHRTFQTKTAMAVGIVQHLAPKLTGVEQVQRAKRRVFYLCSLSSAMKAMLEEEVGWHVVECRQYQMSG